ncbi:MAG: hypothetical protein KAR40_06725 [Candidatus Sabulitectum sp.]|nr:hypothetical protein [Candidatus Sabulitectum sp.]
MNTKYLLIFLAVLFLLPWTAALSGSNETVGMPASDEHAIVQGDSDVYDSVWHVHWVRTAFAEKLDPRVYGDISLAWHNMGWPDLFFSFITGSSYNLMLFFGALFSAFTGFLLARSWGLGKSGSLLAGFIIAWMPVRLIRMYQHYTIASIGYVLLVMLFLRNWVLKGGARNLILLIFFAAVAVMESLYHGVTIAFGWLISSFLMGRKYAKRSLIAGALAGAGCILGSLWFFTTPGALGQNPEKDWKEAVFWAAEPQSFFLPSFMGNPLIPDYMPNDFEGVVTPGATVAILALLYCWMKRSWKALLAVLAVVILSMGPLLKINGIPTPVPLPYLILVKLPWLSAARAPSRLAILAGIMAAIAAGAFVERRKPKAAWLLTGLILLEIVPWGVRLIDSTIPGFYSTDVAAGLTLEIPSSDLIRRYSLFSTADSSPRIVKFLARGGERQMENIPAGLIWGSTAAPDEADIILTGAETVVYNRWMFTDSIRNHYDFLYKDIFPEQGKGDSVWVWVRTSL